MQKQIKFLLPLAVVLIVCILLVCAARELMNQTDLPPKFFSEIYNQTSFQNEIRAKILEALQTQREGEIVDLAEVTPFDWERVCFFGMGASHDYINQVLGIEWLKGEGFVHEQRQLLVFVKEQQVIQHLLFRPEIFGSRSIKNPELGVCLSSTEAKLMIAGYDSPDGRIKIYMLPD